MNEKLYDAVNHEGGEGYNPIREAREQREMAARAAQPKELDDFAHDLDKAERLAAFYRREGGDVTKAELAVTAAKAAWIDAKAADDAEFVASGWSRDVTVERRARWNASMKSWVGSMFAEDIINHERKIGFTMNDLKRAIKLYNI